MIRLPTLSLTGQGSEILSSPKREDTMEDFN